MQENFTQVVRRSGDRDPGKKLVGGERSDVGLLAQIGVNLAKFFEVVGHCDLCSVLKPLNHTKVALALSTTAAADNELTE